MFVFVGTVLWCVCGVIGMHMTTQLFEDYGPSEGNPATDPAPEWIKGLGLYSEWRLVDPDKPGNYYPMVTRRLEVNFWLFVIFLKILKHSIVFHVRNRPPNSVNGDDHALRRVQVRSRLSKD